MRRFVVIEKSFNSQFMTIDPWMHEIPVIPAATTADVTVRYAAFASWESNATKPIVIDGGESVITTTGEMVGSTFNLQAPFDWVKEGFICYNQLYMLIVVNDEASLVTLDVICLSGNTATVKCISVSADISINVSNYFVALVQDINIAPQCILVKTRQLKSDYNSKSLFDNNADRAMVSNSTLSETYNVYMPDWSPSEYKYIPISTYEVVFQVANVHHMQDAYNVFAEKPQYNCFSEKMYLVYGYENAFTINIVKTSHLNFNDADERMEAEITVDDGNNIVVNSIPVGYDIIDKYFTYMGGDLSHLSHATNSIKLLQKRNDGGSYEQPIKYDVINYDVPTVLISDGTRVAVVTGKPIDLNARAKRLLIYLSDTVTNNLHASNHMRSPATLKPWDAVSAVVQKIDADLFINKITSYFAFISDISGNSYSGEIFEAQPPFVTLQEIASQNLQYNRLYLVGSWDGIYYGESQLWPYIQAIFMPAANEATYYVRNHLAKYINKRLDGVNIVPDSDTAGYKAYLCVAVETNKGNFFEKLELKRHSVEFDVGDFVVTDDEVVYTSPSYDKMPATHTIKMWAVSLHLNEVTSYPLKQWVIGVDDYICEEVQADGSYKKLKFTIPRTHEIDGKYIYMIRAYVGITTNTNDYVQTKMNVCVIKEVVKKRDIDVDVVASNLCNCSPNMPVTKDDKNSTIILPPKLNIGVSAGDYRKITLLPNSCYEEILDGLYPNTDLVDEIPSDYVDILLHFDNYVNSDYVNGDHFFRIRGQLKRIDDEIEKESYVTVDLKELDIYRGFAKRYELELFINFREYLWSIELMKHAKTIDIRLRQGWLREIKNLIFVDAKINDRVGGMVITVTLRDIQYRSYYKYK